MKKQLSKSEAKELNAQLNARFGTDFFTKKDKVEIHENEYTFLVVNNTVAFFEIDGQWMPHLKQVQEKNVLKEVIVDMGAVKFVINGADIMRPGVVSFADGIEKEEIIVIVDETHKKPLAIGQMLLSGSDATAQTNGKVIKNIHWVGDKIWHA